jgi:hypothetical protein
MNLLLFNKNNLEENLTISNADNIDDQEKALNLLKNLNSKYSYALCISDMKKYNLGIKKMCLFAIEFLEDNYTDWDIINLSSENNEIWSAQKPFEIPEPKDWESIADYMGSNFIKKIYRLPYNVKKNKTPYYMNTYCPIYAINLKNIKKITDSILPIKINNILINFLENMENINLFFTNANINKIFDPNYKKNNIEYNPIFFIDWYGGDPKNKIDINNIFNLKIHKSLIFHLTDGQIIERLKFKINKNFITPNYLRIKWFNDDSDYNIQNNLFNIQISFANYFTDYFLKSKVKNKPFNLEISYICPVTEKKLYSKKENIKLTNQ